MSPCERGRWGLRWISLWGYDPRDGCAEIGVEPHANAATGAFGGAPYGATILVRGVPKWVRRRYASAATGAFSGDPYGATFLVRGVPKWASVEPPMRQGRESGTGVLGGSWAWGHDPREGCADMKLRL